MKICFNKMQKNLYCSNCGKFSHLYRDCKEPITSYGVILYKIHENTLNFLLIRRKDTLTYVEFIRGRYNTQDIKFITKLIYGMTSEEKKRLSELDFEELWNLLWINPNLKQHRKEFETSSVKFKYLKENNILQELLKSINSQWNEPEWGFPKGRRNLYEDDIACAEREFIEETGIKKNDYIILKHINPITEVFTGTNNIPYKHVYYIGLFLSDSDININENNKYQVAEVGKIGWFNYNDSMNLIRPYNIEKKRVLTNAYKLINKLCIKQFNYLM